MFYIDIEDGSGNRLGTGPITSAHGWKVARKLDAAGTWSFSAPMSDVKVAQATPRRYAHIYAWLGGSYHWVGGGPIDSITAAVAADGTVMAEVAGTDMLRELAWRTVGSLALSDGAGQPISHAAAVAAVMALAPTGWTYVADAAPGWNQVYGQFGGETVLTAIASVAKRSQTHYYLNGRRTLVLGSAFVASGVRCVAASGALGAGQAAITSLKTELTSYDLVSRVIPVGSGQSKVALTLRATGRAAPAGYTLAAAANYLRNDAVEATYGRCERVVAFKDIGPLSSTTADVVSAANMLYDAAKYWLDQHSQPVAAYAITLAQYPTLVRPLQTVRVVWRDPAQNLTIDRDLYVLGVEWAGDANGVRTAGLAVADAPLLPGSDVGAVVENFASGRTYQALPQLNANSYVIPYSKPVDDTSEAQFRFRFDEDCLQLVRVVLDFQLLPLESTVKTVGASSATSAASGDHTHTVTITDHSHGFIVPAHSHGFTVAAHSHGFSVSAHTHGVPSHQHNIQIELGSAPTYPIGFGAAGTSGGLKTGTGSGTFNLPTNASSGATTSNSGGGTSTTTDSGGGTSTTTDSGGGTSTSTAGGGGSLASSASGGSHTHTVTPTITTTYGIYRDDAGNVFGLTDLEYSLDGSTWYGFTVGVNGFANLSGGWYRVDLTALLQDATTLRPLASNNLLRIRRKATGAIKRATIDAQLGVRNIIQALALN